MNSFSFFSPTFFAFGKDGEKRTGELLTRFGAHKVLIHYGGGSVVRSGLLDRVKASIEEAGLPWVELGGVQPNPRDGLVYKGIDLCRAEGVDFILAVGGGSVIDSSKAMACGVVYDGDFWDFFGKKKPVEKSLPVGTILTIPAAGSEGSASMVITKEEGMIKKGTGNDFIRPVFSILNPELTCTLPPYQTACGAVDMIAHVFERYFTNTTEVELTDRLCEAVVTTVVSQVPRVLKDPYDLEARSNIMWASTLAHNDLCGVGREQDWSSHNIEHELSALYDVAHGAGLAVIFPAWMKYVYKHDVMRFAQAAVRIWGCQMNFENPEATALEGIARFEAFLKSIGMPTTFAELGAREEDIPLMAGKIGYVNGVFGKFVKLTKEDIENIYRLAL